MRNDNETRNGVWRFHIQEKRREKKKTNMKHTTKHLFHIQEMRREKKEKYET